MWMNAIERFMEYTMWTIGAAERWDELNTFLNGEST